MRQRIIIWSVAAITAIAIAGCNSAAGPSSGTASQAPASNAAPSQLIPSVAIPSGLASAIPSFALPSPDAALEAKLPDQMCGETSLKSSAAGGTFAAGNAQIQAFLLSIGKTSSDMSFAAAAGGTTGCAVEIVEIKGATAAQMHDQFVANLTQAGAPPQEKSIGGKTVLVGTASNAFGYAYFKDDMGIFFSAPDDAKAAELATTLP
jgi:hypothetical protein